MRNVIAIMTVLLCAACALLYAPSEALAAVYYIDFATGSNSNNGTSKSTPFKHAPGMQGCSVSCAAVVPQPGDKFIFKGGVTWDHTVFQMNISWSGTSGNPIYFGVDPTWYAGSSWTRPIFNGDRTQLASGSSLISIARYGTPYYQYITLDNLELKGHMAFSNWGSGSITHACVQNLIMSNLYVHDWQLDASVLTDDAHGGIIGNYPSCRPTGTIISNSVISNTEARDAGRQNGVAVRHTDIEYSVIHDVQTAQLFGLVNNSEFYNVSYPALGRGVVGSNQGFDPTPYHENNTYVTGWDGFDSPGVRPGMIYNNVFHDISAGSGAIYPNGCPSTPFYIFNNVIYNIFGNSAIQIDQYGASGTCGEYHIWNNTFHHPVSNNFAPIRQVNRPGVNINILDTRNNHYIHDANADMWASGATQINNNNVSQTNAQADSQGYTVSGRFAPSLGGATINSGINLSSLGISALNSDKTGTARPQGSSWDVGAYQFASKDIYIAQSQAGTGDGSNCANARPVAFFNTASNWGNGAAQIGPGTTVHVCGTITGAPGSSILTFQGSGSLGSPITLEWEAGAQISAPYCAMSGNGSGCIVASTIANPRSYIALDGGTDGSIINTANGTGLTYQQNTQAIQMESCTNCEVKNLSVSNLYVQIAGDTSAEATQVRCITWSGSNNSIHDNTFDNVGWCLFNAWKNGDTNNSVYNNSISHVAHAMIHATDGTPTGSDFFFHNNHIYNYANWDSPGCVYHNDGIHTWGNNAGAVFTGFYVYNNIFEGPIGNCITGHIFLSPDSHNTASSASIRTAYIFNNIFTVDGEDSNGAVAISGGSEYLVMNNTLVKTGAQAGLGLNWSKIDQNAGRTLTFKNNAISGFYALVFSDVNGDNAHTTADYNAYAQCTGGGCFWAFYPGGAANWTQYLTNQYGQEQHSVQNTAGTLGLNALTWAPQAGSIVIGAGTNLTNLCSGNLAPLCSDIKGNVRPASGAWDAGACQYVASVILYGDVSENGSVTAYDASLAAQYAVGLINLTGTQLTKADVSGNGSVTSYDASLIAQYAVGLITKFPVQG